MSNMQYQEQEHNKAQNDRAKEISLNTNNTNKSQQIVTSDQEQQQAIKISNEIPNQEIGEDAGNTGQQIPHLVPLTIYSGAKDQNTRREK